MNTKPLSKALRNMEDALRKHSPEILTGIGIAGMITTTVLAVRATPKALICIEERKEELETEKLRPKELVLATWRCYIPATAIGTASILCLIGASSVNVRRRAALATAYSLSESAFREYQEKVVEAIGDKKEEAIRDSIAKEKIEQHPVSTQQVIITERGNTLCYDSASGRYFRSDMEKLKKAENELNRRMRDEMFISWNDFNYEVGLPHMSMGDDLGWNIDTGYLELRFSSQIADDGTPCLVIDYHVEPRYDYRNNG